MLLGGGGRHWEEGLGAAVKSQLGPVASPWQVVLPPAPAGQAGHVCLLGKHQKLDLSQQKM